MPVSLIVRGAEATSVFSLLGGDENAATFALGWTISRSDSFLRGVFSGLNLPFPEGEIRIELQRHSDDGGYTDIEIIAPDCHLILEAKIGVAVAGVPQLSRYRSRFGKNVSGILVSVSAAPEYVAARLLPPTIDGVVVKHLSWDGIRAIVRASTSTARGSTERRWLNELHTHLESYVAAQTVSSNLVYVVALSSAEIGPGYSWIDVVESDRAYFHPVNRGAWPTTPPNYLGFRYNGQLQSVRHVESSRYVSALGDVDDRWSEWKDHMLYRLGPPMKPASVLRSGMSYANRVYCALDLLLSGACETIREAQLQTAARLAAQN